MYVQSEEERALSGRLQAALEPAVLLGSFPKVRCRTMRPQAQHASFASLRREEVQPEPCIVSIPQIPRTLHGRHTLGLFCPPALHCSLHVSLANEHILHTCEMFPHAPEDAAMLQGVSLPLHAALVPV